ncbi:hypothetical protein M409DRAFT_27227 [Zasmidium cellare ATCC 36951]|uniref:Uncharacterized protein n=1 Tax=Zasmidium cellare ATCC 36951 TaxID=1080233 RepID=A0A6A6C5A1_ZASCE|nr:uncharacterized protein M409DRAFT_27227 [Zasmidium cellare ATCC 36951]KAF2162221.1 hypothetical protein M409DRAFT_27227 [Zasmidium cellare ATCC 36951]
MKFIGLSVLVVAIASLSMASQVGNPSAEPVEESIKEFKREPEDAHTETCCW